MKKMFDKVDIVDNMILGKVDNDNVDNDTVLALHSLGTTV